MTSSAANSLLDSLQAALGPAYRLERELGGGGMSRVFLAEDASLGRQVVVKVLPAEMAVAAQTDRFRREIQVAARLQHPHIVPVHAAGAAGTVLYYTMPYVAGESLRARLDHDGALPSASALRIWRDVLDALAYAHSRGIVHRDVKPDNILIDGRHALVTDFGIARALEAATGDGEHVTSTGMVLGTPAYMAPEQVSGDRAIDQRTDVYAAGLVMYEMLTGRSPFAGLTGRELLSAQLSRNPVPLATRDPRWSAELAKLVMRCLAKDPGDRPAGADAVLLELERVVSPAGSSAADGVRRLPHRRPVIAVVAVVLALSAGLGWAARAGRLPFLAPTPPAADSLRLLITVVEVKHDSADATLARYFAETVLAELAKDPWLRPRMPDSLARAAVLTGYSPASLTRDTIIHIARQFGMNAFVTLAVSRVGSGYLFSGEVTGATDGHSAGDAREAASDAKAVPGAIQRLAERLRRRLVAARKSLPRTPATYVTGEVSPVARQLYIEASSHFQRRDYLEAARLALEATRADSTFAEAWRIRSSALQNAGIPGHERLTAMSNAFRLRDRVRSPVEKLLLSADYWLAVGNEPRSIAAFDSVMKLIGARRDAPYNNAGIAYRSLRRYDIAERIFRGIVDTTYEWQSNINTNLVNTLIRAGKIDEAKRELARMEFSDSTHSAVSGARYLVLTGTRAWDEFDRFATRELGRARTTSAALRTLGYARASAAVRGRVAAFDSLGAERGERFAQAESPAGVLAAQLERARLYATLLDDPVRGRAIVDSALARVPWAALRVLDRPYVSLLSTYASLGDLARADSLVAEWTLTMPAEFKGIDSLDVVAARGEVALASGNPREALQLFRLADVRGCTVCFFPRYARTHDALGNRDSSLLWYERYVTTPYPGIPMVDAAELARAYRRLGELYEERGEWRKAIERYEDYVVLWRNADPVLQRGVQNVQARLTRLRARVG